MHARRRRRVRPGEGPRSLRGPRGVSLVEALVALAVMAFGMLAIVGIQSSMRLNSDVAKQRSEAVRIAQEAIEQWRTFTVMDTTPGSVAYADIGTMDDTQVAGYVTNTTYTLRRSVSEPAGQNQKVLQVEVLWTDRAEGAQSVVLHGAISAIEPAITGALVTPPAGNPSKRPRNRHAAIPTQARDMGNGTSLFKPPQPGGGSVAWVFNNTTGMITGVCTVTDINAVTVVDIASCSDNTTAHLLSGYVRFAASGSTPTAAQAENPTGTARRLAMAVYLSTPQPAGQETEWAHPGSPQCFDDAPSTTAQGLAATSVAYYCLIPANIKRVWAGYATILPQAFTDDAASAWSIPVAGVPSPDHLLCRYTPATSDSQRVPNAQHPRLYRVEYLDPERGEFPIPMPPLPNQNFLVIDAGYSCPTDTPADPAAGDFVNSNTLQHLPL